MFSARLGKKHARWLAAALTASAAATCLGGDIFVLPAVADLQPGLNGSRWATEVRVIKLDPAADVSVRRLWVCVPGGGFLDDPATAPTWRLPPDGQDGGSQLWPLSGAGLLQGTSSRIGAAAIDVTGGQVVVQAYVADTSFGGGADLGLDANMIYGLGQGFNAITAPLVGPSLIPWIQAEYADAQSWDSPFTCTSPFRNDIGVVNPNPEPILLHAQAVFFWSDPQPEHDTFEVTVPAFGWKQVTYRVRRDSDCIVVPWGRDCSCPRAGVLNLTPNKTIPYYAYASVVYTPPDRNLPQFSDPMFVLARPGTLLSTPGGGQLDAPINPP